MAIDAGTQSDLVLVRTEARDGGRIGFVTANNPAKRNAIGMPDRKSVV